MADRIKGITVEIGGDVTGLNKALSGTNKQIKDTQAQLKDVERLLKLDPTNTELLEQRQRLLADAVSETKEKLDTLKAAEKQVQQQFERGEVSQKQYDGLQREIAATEQELKRLEEKAKTSSAVMTKVGNTAKSVAEGTDKLADSVDELADKAKVASAAVVAGGLLALKAVSDIDGAVGTFIARTGEAVDSTEEWKNALEEIYKGNYGEGYEDVAQSAAAVKQVLEDITPGGLIDATENAIALRDTFDYDVSESVRAAKALMDNFGVSAEEAFNLIASGVQNGLDYSGELLDTISEYSVQFSKVGFSADDFFGILQAGADSGAFNLDKVGDAVKELSVRVVDGSDSTAEGFALAGLAADEMAQKFAAGGDTARDAFFETVQAIAAIEDPVEQNIAGVDLLGTMWEDLGASVVLAMGEASGAAYGASDALEQIKQQKYDTLISDLQTVGRTAVNDIVVPLGEQLMPTVERVIGKVAELVGAFSNMSSGQKTAVIAVGALIAVLPVLLSLFGGLLTVVGTVSGAIALFTGAATTGTAAATGLAAVLKGASAVIGGVGTAFSTLATFITGTVVPAITSSLSGLFAFIVANPIVLVIAAVTAAVVGLVVLIATKGEEILVILQNVDAFLQGVFATDWSTVFGPVLGEILNAFFANVKNIWDAIKQIFTGVIDFIRGVFTGDWQRAWQGVQDIFGGIFDGLVALAKAPLNGIIGLLNMAINAINSLINGFNSIGFDLPGWLGGGSWHPSIPTIPNIPYLAKGGVLLSGSAVVGEAGPELLTVGPNGTRVQPLTPGERAKAAGSVTIEQMNFYGYKANEGSQIAREINVALGRVYA